MSERTVFLKTAAVLLVIVVGWLARRHGRLTAETTSALSRFAVDIAFPALVFVQMLRTVDAEALRAGWSLPVLCAFVIVVGWLVGLTTAPFFSAPAQRRTFSFLVAFTNFVYLPLPIAEALYGEAGVRAILLINVGGQITFWTLGMAILQGRMALRQASRQVLANPGVLATVAGIVVAVFVPSARGWETVQPTTASAPLFAAGAVMQALAMVGGLTVPLSLLIIGAQLAELSPKAYRPSRALVGVLAARLLVAPAITVALLTLASRAGWHIPEVARMCTYLVAAMSVGFSCSVLAERFGGDAQLSAQAVFYSTFCSLFTAPAFLMLIQRLGL